MKARSKAKPPIEAPFWRKDGELYYAKRSDLESAIRASGHSEEALKRRLGAGYAELEAALEGKRISGWSVSHIEWGLKPEKDRLL